MTKLQNFLLGIKRPKRFLLLSVLAILLTAFFVSIHFFGICSERWILMTATVSLVFSIWLYLLYVLVSWGQTADLLQKTYHDLRQYEIVFEEIRLIIESVKGTQKIMDDQTPSVDSFIEWVNAELQHIEQNIELMKESVEIIKNIKSHINHD